MKISGIQNQSLVNFETPLGAATNIQVDVDKKEDSFLGMVHDCIKQINQADLDAKNISLDYQTGKPVEIHEVMIKQQVAAASLDLGLQVRNKVMDLHDKITGMQV